MALRKRREPALIAINEKPRVGGLGPLSLRRGRAEGVAAAVRVAPLAHAVQEERVEIAREGQEGPVEPPWRTAHLAVILPPIMQRIRTNAAAA